MIAAKPAWLRSIALLDDPRRERAPTPTLPREERERGGCAHPGHDDLFFGLAFCCM